MANNSNRKAIEFMVQGALPPHSTNVLWMDTSVPTLPVLKTFENGAWTTVHTESGKIDGLLVETVYAQQREITQLTDEIKNKMAQDATVAKEDNATANKEAIIAAIPSIPTDYAKDATVAKEAAATSNKNEVKQEIRNVAGSCIIPDFELPCLPFEKDSGFSGLFDDGDFYFGDFGPQVGDLVSQLFVGAIIKVTGDNATEDEFESFPAGSEMSVAHTVSEEEASYEQGLYGSLQEGDPVYGVTSEITWQKDHYYRVTGFHDTFDMTNHRVIEGFVITYEEVDTATITDIGKKIVEKLDEVKEVTAKETTAQEIKELVLQVLRNVEHTE